MDSFGIWKGLPFVRFLNYEIAKLRESGMLKIILLRNNQEAQKNCEDFERNEDNVPLSFQKIIFLFSLLSLGMIISFIMLAIENIISKFWVENFDQDNFVKKQLRNLKKFWGFWKNWRWRSSQFPENHISFFFPFLKNDYIIYNTCTWKYSFKFLSE